MSPNKKVLRHSKKYTLHRTEAQQITKLLRRDSDTYWFISCFICSISYYKI